MLQAGTELEASATLQKKQANVLSTFACDCEIMKTERREPESALCVGRDLIENRGDVVRPVTVLDLGQLVDLVHKITRQADRDLRFPRSASVG